MEQARRVILEQLADAINGLAAITWKTTSNLFGRVAQLYTQICAF